MSGVCCFAPDQFSPQLRVLTRRMARAANVTASQMALTAQEARLLMREIALAGPAAEIEGTSRWICCHSPGNVTILGENASMTASVEGTQLRWLRCSFDNGVCWHMDFPGAVKERERLPYSPSLAALYGMPDPFMRIRIAHGIKVTTDFSYDEFLENQTDEADWESRIPAGEDRIRTGVVTENRCGGAEPASLLSARPSGRSAAGQPLCLEPGPDYIREAQECLSVIASGAGSSCPGCGSGVSRGDVFCHLCGCRLPWMKGRAGGDTAIRPEFTPKGIAFVKKVLTTIKSQRGAALRGDQDSH